MTDPNRQNQTATPPLRYHSTTLTVEGLADQLNAWAAMRRDLLLREVAELEREHLGYGTDNKPTTSELRSFWQKWRGRCPYCGKGLK
jgi:hypothetical protein